MSTRPHYQSNRYQDAPTSSQSKSLFDQNAHINYIFFVNQMFLNIFPRFIVVLQK